MTDQIQDAFEQLAERGQRRGADRVREGALHRVARRRRGRRLLLASVVTVSVALLSAPLWWPSRGQSTGVVTTPPDVVAPPVVSVDVDMPLATTDGWRPVLTIPYGDAIEQLGVDRVFGPESAAMNGNSLVVLDTNKGRLATYLDDGTFGGATPLPSGSGTQFVTPIAGGVVISGVGKAFALPSGGTEWLATSAAGPYTDGTSAFCCDGVSAVRFTNGRPEVEATNGYRTRDGRRFGFHREGTMIEIKFLDPQPHTTRLNLKIDGAAAKVSLVSEVAADSYGNVVLLVYGDESQDRRRSALVLVAPDGGATVVSAPSPFGATHSGTPQALATGAGDRRVIVEAADGLEVWMPSPRTDPALVPRAFEVAASTGCEHLHEDALTDDSSIEGSPLAVVRCRIGERQIAVVVYQDHAAVDTAAAELGRNCGTRVIGDDWIVQTNTPEASALVAQRIGGQVPSVQNC